MEARQLISILTLNRAIQKIIGREKKEKPQIRKPEAWNFGGVDGTRTRDPRRDRPVF